jgi:hypothetical protein
VRGCGAGVLLAAAFIIPNLANAQAVWTDSTILMRVDTLASEVRRRGGLVDHTLRRKVAAFLDSPNVDNVVKADHRMGWLITLSATTIPVTRDSKVGASVSDTIDIKFTSYLRGARAFGDSVARSCFQIRTLDTKTISGRAAANVDLEINNVCRALRLAAQVIANPIEWRWSDRVPMDEAYSRTVRPPQVFTRTFPAVQTVCADSKPVFERVNWVSTTASTNILSQLSTLCGLVAGLAYIRDSVYEVKLEMLKRPRPPTPESLLDSNRRVRALALLVDVMEYQMWRDRQITNKSVDPCKKVVAQGIRALAAVIGFDNDRGVAASLVVPLVRLNLLLGGRKVEGRPGGIFELGVGQKSDTPGDASALAAFGTLFYDTDSRHLGAGVMAMPFTWKAWRMGAGIATDGSISMRIGVPSPARPRNAASSQLREATSAERQRVGGSQKAVTCVRTD